MTKYAVDLPQVLGGGAGRTALDRHLLRCDVGYLSPVHDRQALDIFSLHEMGRLEHRCIILNDDNLLIHPFLEVGYMN